MVLLAECKCFGQTHYIDSLIKASENSNLINNDRIGLLISIYKAYDYEEQYYKGKPYLDTALELALKNGLIERVADVKVELGRYYLTADDYVEAQRLLIEAKRTYKFENYVGKACVPLKYLGLIYYQKDNYSEAISYLDEAISEADLGKFNVESFTSKYLKALALTKIDSLDEAYHIFMNILSQPDSIVSRQRRMETNVGTGDVFLKKNKLDSASYYYLTAYTFFDHEKNVSAISYAGTKLANLYLIQNRVDSALMIAMRCYTIADSTKNKSLKYEAAKIISDAYLKKNNFKDAFYFLNVYDSLRGILYDEENDKKLLQFNIKAQKADNEAQQRLNEKEALQQQKVKNTFIGAFILTTLLLIISLVSIKQNRKKTLALKKSKDEVQHALNKLQNTQEELIRQEKLASLGKMVAGIAHEIQNPLNFVKNFSESSVQLIDEIAKANQEEQPQLLNELSENMGRIQEHSNRASGIVRSMLMYSRNESFEKQKTDINIMLNDFIPLAYEGLHSSDPVFSCRVEKNFAELPLVLCSAQDISRVLLNLLTNAFYAVNDKKKTANEYFLPLVIIKTQVVEEGIKITIRDNGKGIPDAIKEKIFEPFYTTKPAGTGTGLGLSLSYDLIKAHRGTLKVESRLDVYTEFSVTLPLSEN